MSECRDPATNQLANWAKTNSTPEQLTTGNGAPIGNKLASMTIGRNGPILLKDHILQDELSHFQQERIPERVVHAKGAGAFGIFEVTHDITNVCKASLFSFVGKKTPVCARFSTVGGESGSADTARDPRGFAVKFYTDEGNWDMTGNNTPIFFIRDPIFFPSFIHTQKRNPVTHLKDPDMFWDFLSLRPESCHQVSFLFGDRGTPDGYRHMNGYGSHTFKLVNMYGVATYCKFHFKTDQGIKNLDVDTAAKLASSDPDYAIRDLYNAIEKQAFPSWTMYIQTMGFTEAEHVDFNPFDVTKVWPQARFPLKPVGKLTLNRNPKNYFADVEQAAFSPAHFVPGIEASPDRMLQGRLYSYSDTHRHRLGTNYQQIPVNCPFATRVKNYQRDASASVQGNGEGAPNYFPNSFKGPIDNVRFNDHAESIAGDVKRYDTGDEDNFSQVGVFWRKVLNDESRARLAANIAGALKDAQPFIQERAVANFAKCDPEYGATIQKNLDAHNKKQSNKL